MKFDVDYYNQGHERMLARSPFAEQIETMVTEGVEVDIRTLMVYMLFTEQKPYEGFSTFHEIEALLPRRIAEIEDYFDFSGGTLQAKFPSKLMGTHCTERAGVGAALVATNALAGLNHADWERIDVSQVKDLDFRHRLSGSSLLASNGTSFVEIEAKGSVVMDVESKPSAVSNHRRSVEEKKEEQRSRGKREVMLGVITAIPVGKHQVARIHLLDPPASEFPVDPAKYQLLARLLYYRRICSYVTRLQMLPALSTRIASLAAAEDYTYLDGRPLLDWAGKAYGTKKWAFRNKSIIPPLEAVGRAYPVSFEEFVFQGHAIEVLDLIAKQRFQEIADYSASKAGTHAVDFDAIVSRAALSLWGLLDKSDDGKNRGWRRLRLRGDVTVLRSGFVFGLLKNGDYESDTEQANEH